MKLADENAVRDRDAATKRAAAAKTEVRRAPRKLADENVSRARGKNSQAPEKREKRIPKQPKADKQTSDKQNSDATHNATFDALEDVRDIDAGDGDYLEFCSDYVKRIYDHLFVQEAEHPVKRNYLQRHPELNPDMRAVLIEWLVSLQNRFKLLQDTLILAVSIMDRMLSNTRLEINRENFQLLGASCLWVASKYEEMYSPSVSEFVYVCADAYTTMNFRKMEAKILTTLGFQFAKPLSSHFLRRFSKAAGGDAETHRAAKYLIELSLYCYELVDSLPSVIAAAALFVAGSATGRVTWNSTMEFYSRYKPEDFKREALKIAEIAVNPHEAAFLRTTLKKYSSARLPSITHLFTTTVSEKLFRSQAHA